MQRVSGYWKNHLRTLLNRKEALTPDERDSLRKMLLAEAFERDGEAPASKHSPRTARSFLQSVHRTGTGYVLSAALAAAVAVVLVRPAPQTILPEEVATLHHANQFPADFDLNGEPQRLESEFQRVLARQSVSSGRPMPQGLQNGPPLPRELRNQMELGSGRFVSWRGKPGVSLRVRNAAAGESPSLVIVTLGGGDDPLFASEKHVEEIRSSLSTAPVRLTTWREEDFGYALFEPGR